MDATSPTTSPTPSTLSSYSTSMRQLYDAEIRNASPQDLLATFNNAVRGLSRGVVQSGHPFEAKLHDIWYLLIEAAKHTDVSSPLQDSLVLHTLMARQLGDLGTGRHLWADLPFLGNDLELTSREIRNREGDEDRWRQERNLAAFMARLFAACDGDDGLQDILAVRALEVFRDVLEMGQGADYFALMLRPATMWLQHAGRKLAVLSSEGRQVGEDIGLGPLAEDDEVCKGAPLKVGFSPARWRFWTRRIRELEKSEDDEVRKLAETAGYWIDEWMMTLRRGITEVLY
ncbi:hypothetical protein F4808DRAFT_381227 [Astrocystis sublimbata]|nr:hypothetical protein F4808DRAFT_381227 [Astrocystis sublimbata]